MVQLSLSLFGESTWGRGYGHSTMCYYTNVYGKGESCDVSVQVSGVCVSEQDG